MKWLNVKIGLGIFCLILYRSSRQSAIWTIDNPKESRVYWHGADRMLGAAVALLGTGLIEALLTWSAARKSTKHLRW